MADLLRVHDYKYLLELREKVLLLKATLLLSMILRREFFEAEDTYTLLVFPRGTSAFRWGLLSVCVCGCVQVGGWGWGVIRSVLHRFCVRSIHCVLSFVGEFLIEFRPILRVGYAF